MCTTKKLSVWNISKASKNSTSCTDQILTKFRSEVIFTEKTIKFRAFTIWFRGKSRLKKPSTKRKSTFVTFMKAAFLVYMSSVKTRLKGCLMHKVLPITTLS